MDIDFSALISERVKDLKARITRIEDTAAQLKLSGPIEFSVSDIQPPSPKTGVFIGVEPLEVMANPALAKASFVYIYELVNSEDVKLLLDKYGAGRDKHFQNESGKEFTLALPKKNTSNESESKALYVGSVKSNIASRIKQHLGNGYHGTYAMHLKHWASPDIKLRFYYIQLDDSKITYEVEAALTKMLKPLLGKAEV